MTESIRGFWVALASPLGPDGRLDCALFARHARELLDRGVDGVLAFGTTGEGPSFGVAERMAGIGALLGAGIAPDRIGLGCGYPAMADSTGLVRDALGIGLVHMLLLPPYFFRDASPGGLEDAFAAILDGVADERLRVTLYNIPQMSGVRVPPETAARLRQRYGRRVAGIKDSSGDFAQFQAYRRAAPDLAITVGHEPHIARALAEGGAGTICGLGNVAPELIRAVCGGSGVDGAVESLVGHFAGRPFVPALKAVIAAQTGLASWGDVRPPLRPTDAADGRRIAALLRQDLTEAA